MVDRTAIRDQLLTFAKPLLDFKDKANLKESTADKQIYMSWNQGLPLMQCFKSIDGLYPEDFRKFTENWYENVKKIVPNEVKIQKIDSDGGNFCVHQRVVPPVPLIRSRSLILTYYSLMEDDTHIFMVSSKGNEHLLEKHKAELTDDIVAKLDVNCMRFAPKYDSCGDLIGTEISQIVQYDPCGDIPDILKSLMTKYQSSAIDQLCDFIKTLN